MGCFQRLRVFWPWHPWRKAAGVRCHVSILELWNVHHVVRRQHLLDLRRSQIDGLVSFHPFFELRRNFQVFDKLLPRWHRVGGFGFLGDLRITFAEQIESEQPDRLRPRCRRCHPGVELDCACSRCALCPAREYAPQREHCKEKEKTTCFPHAFHPSRLPAGQSDGVSLGLPENSSGASAPCRGAYSAPDRAAPEAVRTYAQSVEMESDLNGETHRNRFAIGAKRWL